MRKKSVVLLLSLLSAFGFVFAAGACGENPANGGETVTISGFEVEDGIEVNVGAIIELEQPIVTDSKGVLLDCWTYVTDASGNYVAVTAGSFTADNVGEYIITYVVRDSANNTYEKQTKVTVLGDGSVGEEITLGANFEQFITVGEEVAIEAVCSAQDATISYKVVDYSSGEELSVLDGKFTPQEAGIYEVYLSANDGAASYKYNVFAELPLQTGEVESFGGAWAEKEAFVGGKRQDWEIVSSSDCGITDPYGREATLAKYTTTRQYIPLYLNIRENVEYYQQLADEGYTYVSMWIYMESEKPHITISDRDPNGGFYRRSGPELQPGEWAEFRLDLVTGKNTWYRSFVQCYDYYVNQNHFYLQVDNSNEWNISSKNEFWGNEPEITFYFTDIYAVKEVEISVAEGAESEKSVKDTVNLSATFSAEFEMNYSVTSRGETVALDGSEYTFTANGEYVMTATPKDFNLRGSKTFTFNVTDGQVISAQPLIKERTGDSVSVSLSELNASFAEVNGVTPTVEEYRVFYGGKEISVDNGAFTAVQDGAYTVEVKGVYTEGGVRYVTYHSVPVDVYSAQTKYAAIDTESMRAIRAWNWDNSSTTAEYGEYVVGGKTGNFVKATAKGQSLVLYAKPMFSKAYYEALAAENANTKMRIGIYFTPAATGLTTNFRSFYNPAKAEWFDKYNDTWQEYEIPLTEFIAAYDEINGRYETYKSASYGADTGGYEGTWLQLIGSQVGRTAYLDVSIGIVATDVSVSLKDGAAFALKQENRLADVLDVSLDGFVGEIVNGEVLFNGEWIAIDNGVITPVWAGEYAFRFQVASVDGVRYKTVETSFQIGDEPFEATVDTSLHAVKQGTAFDVAALLTEDYTYSVELWRTVGGEKTLIGQYDEATFETAGLSVGAYTVNVYAVADGEALGKILYYTFTLDVWSPEMQFAVLDAENMRAIRAWDWDNTSTTAEYGEYVVGGKTGEFVKLSARGQSLVLYAKPLYSKAYYQAMLEDNPAMKLGISIYFTPEITGKDSNFRSFYNPEKLEWFDKYNDSWQNYELSIAEFIALYDEIDEMYETYASASYGAGTNGYEGTWLQLIGSQVGRSVYLSATLRFEATAATAALAEGKQFVLNESNDLTQLLNVTLDGAVADVTIAEVFFNGEWVTLENCSFTPAWAGEYTFRLEAQTAGGVVYKAGVEVTLQIGDETFQTIEDTTVWAMQTGDTLSLSSLPDEYLYEIEIYDNTRGVMTLAATQTERSISLDMLKEGVYFVKIYAIADGEFGKILYQTMTINYLGAYGEDGVWLEEFTADTYKSMFKSYQYENNQYLTDTTVTEIVPAGNSGAFLKYEGRQGNNKEAMSFAFKPLYTEAFYQSLLEQPGSYMVRFDVWIENVNADCTRTNANCYSWKTTNDGDKFTTHGLSLALGQWHTLEIPLEILLNNLENGEVKFFGVYIPYGGYTNADWVRMYIGNIRLVNEAAWSASSLTLEMLTTYQYSSSQNRTFTSLTTEIPEGGVAAGSYVKWAQTVSKEDMQLAVAPLQTKEYYEAFINSGKSYKITYDVYVTVTTEGCTCTELATKLWTTKADGTHSFATHGKIALNAWHTVEIDLNYLVANWGNYRLFGLNFLNQTNFDRSKDFVTFYLGNIQLVEGEASGVATLKA